MLNELYQKGGHRDTLAAFPFSADARWNAHDAQNRRPSGQHGNNKEEGRAMASDNNETKPASGRGKIVFQVHGTGEMDFYDLGAETLEEALARRVRFGRI